MISGKRSRQQFDGSQIDEGESQHGITISLRLNKETALYQLEDTSALLPSVKGLQHLQANNENSQSAGSQHMQSKRAKKSHNALQVINPPEETYSNFEMSSREPASKARQDEVEAARLKQERLEREMQAYSGKSFIVPSCTAWFNLDQMHEIEMQNLPEFFCGKFPHKNPVSYLNFRNSIIRMYREKPDTYLTASECRKRLPGDVCSVIRLHAFLEQWGLINFHVDAYLRPPRMQLGGSGALSKELIDVVSKGYLSLSDADLFNQLLKSEAQNRQLTGQEYVAAYANPSESVTLLAAQKTNVLTRLKRPTCNFCGNLCSFLWYLRKPATVKELVAETLKIDSGSAQKSLSLHQALRSLTSSFLICKECFDNGNFPKVFTPEEFQATTLRSLLQPGQNQSASMDGANQNDDDAEGDNEEALATVPILRDDLCDDNAAIFSADERAELIKAVSCQSGDLIDWLGISANVFENKYSPRECIFEFLKLPIPQSLALNMHAESEEPSTQIQSESKTNIAGKSLDVSKGMQGEVPGQQGSLTVFNDSGNPLLSQVAIFARLLENMHLEKNGQGDVGGEAAEDSQRQTSGVGAEGGSEEPAKRTTRGASKRKEQESNQVLKNLEENVQAQVNHYLVPPSTEKMLDAVLSGTQLRQIEAFVKARAKVLAQEKQEEMEELLNDIIYQQMKKIRAQSDFIREFEGIYELQKEELSMMKEECLAERFAISKAKALGGTSKKVFIDNEFSISHEVARIEMP